MAIMPFRHWQILVVHWLASVVCVVNVSLDMPPVKSVAEFAGDSARGDQSTDSIRRVKIARLDEIREKE